MCGIAGILTFKDRNASLNVIRLMTNAMKHRGPDDEGFALFYLNRESQIFGGSETPSSVYNSGCHYCPQFTSKSHENSNGVLAFGHRRLAILDLSPAGHQPMCTEDGRFWIIYNGEVYNYQDLKSKLITLGETFISETDTEVILKAFRQWGPDCLQHFNGMFAFAIWDDEKKRLFCARDRIGIKPFYYYLTRDFFLFASDIQAILESGLYAAIPNWEGVYHALSLQCAPRPMTCFKDVYALEQAHYLTVDTESNIIKNRYWHVPTNRVDRFKSECEWLEEFDYLLKLAIKRRLVADVPVGTFMSGGIDSTTVSAVASRLHPGIKAFTLAHKDAPEFDELPQAEAMASLCNIQHIVGNIVPEKVLSHIDDIVRCYKEPFPTLGPTYLISELVQNNKTTVVLSGLGPDELFAGYNRHRWLPWWHNINFLLKGRKIPALTSSKLNRLCAILGSKDITEYYVNVFSPFAELEKKNLFVPRGSVQWDTPATFNKLYSLDSLNFSDQLEAICYMDLINYIGNHHLFRGDLFSMHFSIESRYPFLDHELVEMAFKMPSSLKVKGNKGKYILRQLAEKYIHPSCLKMKKKGFAFPMDRWMRNDMRSLTVTKIARLKERGIFVPSVVDSIATKFWQRKNSYIKLWLLVSIELWLEAFID